MRNIVSLLLLLLLLGICSCKNGKEQNSNGDSDINGKPLHRSNFLDSVAAQEDLPYAQLKKHLPNIADFPSDLYYSGESVFFAQSKYPLVILKSDDRKVCTQKYLIVYDPKTMKSTASVMIATDCDEDDSSDFNNLTYKIFNSKQFFTREVDYIRNEGEKTRITVTDRFYQINDHGGIDTLKTKPAGAVVPVYVPDDNIDDN
jgi:hypothetical protein